MSNPTADPAASLGKTCAWEERRDLHVRQACFHTAFAGITKQEHASLTKIISEGQSQEMDSTLGPPEGYLFINTTYKDLVHAVRTPMKTLWFVVAHFFCQPRYQLFLAIKNLVRKGHQQHLLADISTVYDHIYDHLILVYVSGLAAQHRGFISSDRSPSTGVWKLHGG